MSKLVSGWPGGREIGADLLSHVEPEDYFALNRMVKRSGALSGRAGFRFKAS